jgi:hypothetical protein
MYNTDVIVEFDDDDGYRQCMLAVFSVDPETIDDVDPFIKIEIECDSILEQLNSYQELISIFREMAMQNVHLDNASIGLCLMFSFENFSIFHFFLREFFPLCEELNQCGNEEEINIIVKYKQTLLIQKLRDNLIQK